MPVRPAIEPIENSATSAADRGPESVPSTVVLVVGDPAGTAEMGDRLASGGIDAVERTADNLPEGLSGYAAAIVDGAKDIRTALSLLRRLALRPTDDRCPLLLWTADGGPTARIAGFKAGADVVLSTATRPDEMIAQIRVLDRWQRDRSNLFARAAEAQIFNQRLQQAYKQIELDLALARRLQASFLPQSFPEIGPVRFAVSYRPCGQVGGDFYDVFRLDEHHVGFYVADAMGHGVPASLLTIFLKKAVQAKEVNGTTYRLLPPSEVLARINRDLMAQGLAEMPFITMVYGLLNCQNGRLSIARAAHPHPFYLPNTGTPEVWRTPGTLLGIFEAEYPSLERELLPGDKLLLFTDGIPVGDGPGVLPHPLHAAAEEHRALPIQALVERLSRDLVTGEPQADDFTLLGVEFGLSEPR